MVKSQAGRHVLGTDAPSMRNVRSPMAGGSVLQRPAEWSRAEWSPTATSATGGALHVAEAPRVPDLGSANVPAGLPVDLSSAVVPLAPAEVAPLPHPGRLLRWARSVLALLAHPFPRREPTAPLTRDEQIALARNEAARLARERTAYRDLALGRPIR